MVSINPAMRSLPSMRRGVPWGLALLLLTSCRDDISTPFAPGINPLEANPVVAPAAIEGDATPERVETAGVSRGRLKVGFARGYIHASVADVASALADPLLVADRTIADQVSFTPDVEAGYDESFRLHYTVNGLLPVRWDVTWREGVTREATGEVEGVRARFQKTDGTDFILVFEGSVELTRVSDTVTEFSMIERVEADEQTVEATVSDTRKLFRRLVERVQGTPSP